ncbi:mycothiol-dependent nitroreductase Rv2466c family protein [Williamsia sp. SKLECPSW1]
MSQTQTDLDFYFDPVCPFAWMTSKWVRIVARQRDYTVGWRFISLRQLNAHIDYDSHFPPEYEAQHTAGLKLLRVASSIRDREGDEAVGRFYEALGTAIFDDAPAPDDAAGQARRGTADFVAPILADLGLASDHVEALDDTARDDVIQDETDRALSLTGKDVGTPILHFTPPTGVAFFGPVISRLPDDADALELWDHVIGLASFPGFAEMKRSLRERPQLRAFGVEPGTEGITEDWHAGSRRQKK